MVRYKKHIPHWTKKQFVDWADKRFAPHKHYHMKKKQLIAIHINTKQPKGGIQYEVKG